MCVIRNLAELIHLEQRWCLRVRTGVQVVQEKRFHNHISPGFFLSRICVGPGGSAAMSVPLT